MLTLETADDKLVSPPQHFKDFLSMVASKSTTTEQTASAEEDHVTLFQPLNGPCSEIC